VAKLLAIDTSTNYLSLAITNGDKVISKFHKKADMSHSSLLVPMIDRLLKKARLRLKDIDGFSVSIGPGSFTGLRIGVTTVKGLAYVLKKPIVTVPTLDVIARNIKNFRGIICPVLDAKKGKVYACLYKSDGRVIKRISKYLLLPFDDLLKKTARCDKVIFLGDYPIGKSHRAGGIKDWYPKADIVAQIALEDVKKKRFIKPEDLEPMYIYSKECDITGH